MPIRTDLTYIARADGRYKPGLFGIKPADRLFHMHVIGKTGVGKTTLLETLLRQDIERGNSCALIDPHGDLVERVAAAVPRHRRADLVYLDLPDPDLPYGYNPLMRVSPDKRALVASGLLEVFKKMWDEAWGVRMEHILRNALLALLDQPSATIADLLPLLSDSDFRRQAVDNIENVPVRRFWEAEFEKYGLRYRTEGIAPIQNKVGAFLADPRLHRLFTRSDGQIRLRSIMDRGGILLINLSHGKIGEDSSSLLGGLLVTSLGLAAFSRADTPERHRRPFFIYIDEFQNFTTLAIANMLSELRKFGVGAVLAHQFLDQLQPQIRYAVMGNAGTLIAFRLGAKDAAVIAREFEPAVNRRSLLNLPNHQVYLKLMIDGTPSPPFRATTVTYRELQLERPAVRSLRRNY